MGYGAGGFLVVVGLILALNVAITVLVPSIAWQAHLGGFAETAPALEGIIAQAGLGEAAAGQAALEDGDGLILVGDGDEIIRRLFGDLIGSQVAETWHDHVAGNLPHQRNNGFVQIQKHQLR